MIIKVYSNFSWSLLSFLRKKNLCSPKYRLKYNVILRDGEESKKGPQFDRHYTFTKWVWFLSTWSSPILTVLWIQYYLTSFQWAQAHSNFQVQIIRRLRIDQGKLSMCIQTSPFKVDHSYSWASSEKVRCLFFHCIIMGPSIFFFLKILLRKCTQKINNT